MKQKRHAKNDQNSCRSRLSKSSISSTRTEIETVSINPLQIQISQKLQTLLHKAIDSKIAVDRIDRCQKFILPKGIFSCTEWYNFTLMLQDFINSAKRKLSASLTKYFISHSLNYSAPSKIQSCDIAFSISDKHSQNKELLTLPSSKLGSSQFKYSKREKRNCNIITELSKMEFLDQSHDSLDYNLCNTPDSDGHSEGGMLLLGDAERVPEYLPDLGSLLDSDVSTPSPPCEESDEDVVVLGVKRPTYQEITLEEDDDGKVYESNVKVVEKPIQKENEIEELLFNCSKCNKSFRVESLLKFHLRMHGTETSSSFLEKPPPDSCQSSEDDNYDCIPCKSSKREKENHTKVNSIKKSHHEKHKRRKKELSKIFQLDN